MRLSRRHALAWAAAGLLLASWWSARATGTFTAHMAAHVLAVAVAAPLLARAFTWPRWLTAPTAAAVACGIEFVVVWGWHLPAAHAAASASVGVFVVEQLSFLAAGVALWAGAWPDPSAGGRGALAGCGVLLMTSMHMTLLGALLVLAPLPLYHDGAAALADQQRGALLMLVVCTPVYLGAALALLGRLLAQPGPRPEPDP